MKDSEIDREIAFWEKQAGAKDADLSGKAIDEVRSLIKIKEKNKKDRNQLFVILWIFIGAILSSLVEATPVMAWLIALAIAASYSFLFYKK